MRWTRLTPGNRLLAVALLTILVPGLVLAFLAVQGLWNDRQSVQQRQQERLDHSADLAEGSLREQLQRLQSRIDAGFVVNGALDWPEDGSWAVVTREADHFRLYPTNILPYELSAHEDAPLEEPPSRAALSDRRARELRQAGNVRDAVRVWRTLEDDAGLIGVLPAALVAGFELAKLDSADAQRFYDRLTSGQWRLDKARYAYYASAVVEHVTVNDDAVAAFRLAEAVEAAVAGTRVVQSESGVHVVFRRDAPFAALVVSDQFLQRQVPPAADAQAVVSRIAADGHALFARSSDRRSRLHSVRRFNASGIAWEIDVEPKDAAFFDDPVRRQIDRYLAMVGLVLALFIIGGVVIARSVRREVEVARLKSDFVSTVSHEFRSPLTGIRQLAELLVRDRVLDGWKRRQYYELILHESERLGRLVESVLDFARMEDGRKQYQLEPLETATWLKGVAAEFEREASRAGYVLEASIPDDLPALSADREALSTAVHNLLDNAVKYSPEAKTVWLDAQASGGRVRISVRDRGVGIAERHQSRIFEKFYRVDGELSKRVKGVGLGLSLVRHIVESHSGTLTVDSREGEGSTFSIELARAA